MVLSKGQKLLEIARCIKDPIYGIETYLHTEDRTQGGEVPFKLFPRQKELVNGYVNHKHNIVMKPRQAGISTTTAAYLAILSALSNPENKQRILIAANKQETAKEFLKKIRDFTRQLPAWMDIYRPASSSDWFMKEKNSDSHYRLNNGSEVKAVASSKDALRGYTPSIIVIDEAAFIEGGRGEEFYEAAQPSLSTGGRSILISCVTDDTFVLTPDGIKEISDFIDYTKDGGYNTNEYEVYGYGGSRKSNILYNNGFVDTKIIETKYSKLEGSNNHKLYAFSNKDNKFGWYKLEDLSIGDFVSIHYNNNVWGGDDRCDDFYPEVNPKLKNYFKPEKITTDIAYFMGLFLAEGSTYKKYEGNKHVGTSITISCGDDVSEVFNKLGLNFNYDNKFHYTTGSKQLGQFLEYIGFDLKLKAKNKIIPKRIFCMSKDNVIAFIRGFMDGDGYSRKDNGRVGLCSASKRLVEQFRILFMNLGLLCEYQQILMKPTKKVKVESMNYRLSFNNYYSTIYYELIGFNFTRKQIKNEFLGNYRSNDPRDLIPNGREILVNIYQNQNNGLKYFRDLGCKISHITDNNSKLKHISRGLLLHFLKLTNNQTSEIINDNIVWVKVKSITNSKNNTYDFSLPNNDTDFWCHSVLYNGILGHQTPNGYDVLYHKTYKMAKLGKNNFNIVEMKWYEDPRYNKGLSWLLLDEKSGETLETKTDPVPEEEWPKLILDGWVPTSPWYENMCAQLNHNPRSIAQELNCDFLGSGNGVIDDKYVKRQERDNVRPPIRKEWVDGNMWIWCDPIKDHQYILAADASSGSSDDWAVICIMDYTTGEQVAEYQGKVAPDVLGEIANYYGQSYDAFIVVDITGGWGASTVLKLIDLGYPKTKMFYDVTVGIDSVENNRALQKHMDNGKLPGLNFQKNRNVIISELEKGIRMDSFKVRSMRSIAEMDTFVYINGRPDHMKNYHDDCLMSIGMCLFVAMTSFKDLEKSKGQAKAMVESWVITSTSTENVNTLSRSVDFFMANNDVNHVQQADSQHNWVFGGLPGFKKKKPR